MIVRLFLLQTDHSLSDGGLWSLEKDCGTLIQCFSSDLILKSDTT